MQTPETINAIFKRATCLYTKDDIDAALDRMAQEMNHSLGDKNPIFLCVMIGGIIPLGNLLPRLQFPLSVNYIHTSSYKGTTQQSELEIIAKPTVDLHDRTVVIVDDILDSGITLKAITELCKNLGAREVYTAVLIDKLKSRKVAGIAKCDFTGLEMDDRFVFGYGLDYGEYLRNVPGIYVVAPQDQ